MNEEKEEALHCMYIYGRDGRKIFVDKEEEEERKLEKEIALMEDAWAKNPSYFLRSFVLVILFLIFLDSENCTNVVY